MAWVRRLWWQAWVGYGLGAVAFLGAVVLAVWGQGWYAGLTAVFGLLAAAAGAQRECRRKLVELAGGRPPRRMGEVTVAEAGVNPQDDRFRDLYVERDAEPEVCRLLAEHGRVLVVGESMTGKTRMLLHIAGERFPERWCLSPRGADALARLGALRCVPGEVVLWLDELHEFGDPDFVVALEAWRARGAVVFASLRVAEERRIRDTGEFKDPRARTLDWFASATVRPAVWSATEVGRLRERCPELAGEVGEASLPQHLAGAPKLAEKLRRATGDVRGLLTLAASWRRIGMRQDLPRDVIDHAAVDFLPPLYDSDVAGRIQAALDDACLEVNPSVAALARTGSGYRISDYLLDRDELPTTTPDSLWEAACELATPEEAFAIGFWAYEAGRTREAETWWRKAAEQGLPNAMVNLGVLLQEQGRAGEAETWWRKAAEQGLPDAMNNLGILLKEQDRAGEAETWLHRAAELGNEEAARWLAELNPPGTDQPDEG